MTLIDSLAWWFYSFCNSYWIVSPQILLLPPLPRMYLCLLGLQLYSHTTFSLCPLVLLLFFLWFPILLPCALNLSIQFTDLFFSCIRFDRKDAFFCTFACWTNIEELLHGRGFPSGSVVKNPPTRAGDVGSIPGSAISPGEGNGNPFQYSCLGNPLDRGVWWAPGPWGCERVGTGLRD